MQQPASAPQIVAQLDPVADADLPDFTNPTPEPAATPAPSAQAAAPGAQPPGPIVIPAAQVVRPIVDLICDQMEKRLQQAEGTYVPGRPDPIPEKDRNALATIYGLVAEKHLPQAFMEKWGLEVAAVLLTVTILIPKVFEYRAYWKSREASMKAAATQQQAARQEPAPRIQMNGGAEEAWKEAYARAQAEGRAPI